MSLPSVAIVGTGPVARALAAAHVAVGGVVVAVVSRDAERARELATCAGARATTALGDVADADVVLLAVPDRVIPGLGPALVAAALPATTCILHTSGALAGADLRAPALATGSLHPLQSLPRSAAHDPELLRARLAGTHWFHEGAGACEAAALVRAWGGTFHSLAPGRKAAYHAGAALLSNHTVGLVEAALRLFGEAGVARDAALAPLAHLLRGTAANVAEIGLPGALTGPIARGDVGTVERHLDELRAVAPDLVGAYRATGRLVLAVARAKGDADPSLLDELARLLA